MIVYIIMVNIQCILYVFSGFRGRASEVGKEVVAIKTMKGELVLRDDVPDPGFLKTWYQLDENVVPPVYRLHRIR